MKTKLLLLILIAPFIALGQITQIGGDIDGEVIGEVSGYSVSLNADGNIVAIGVPLSDENGTNSGLVRVYQFAEGSWTKIGEDIIGEAAGDESGFSVSLNANGSIVAIGAPNNDGNGTSSVGHVRIYENSGGSWTQKGEDIDGEGFSSLFGHCVSLSSNGNIVAIGAPLNDEMGSEAGQVRVYQFDGDSWVQIGQDINAEAAGDEFGWSVSLSADGGIIAIGAPTSDGNGDLSGHVQVYQNTGSVWVQIGQDIDGEASFDQSGFSVNLNADGSFVAIGGIYNGSHTAGQTRVYQNIEGTWTKIGEDIIGESSDNWAGHSVRLSSQGSIVAIGAPRNDGNGNESGHVRVYQNIGGNWTQKGLDIDGEAEGDRSGFSVSLSSNGTVLAIGAPGNDGNVPGSAIGHVRIYDLGNVLGMDKISLTEFTVYPNPTSGILKIRSETPISRIDIYNQLGQLVFSSSGTNTIDISSLNQGLYYCKIVNEYGNVGAKKILKK